MNLLLQFFAGILGIMLHSTIKLTKLNRDTPKEVTIPFIIKTYLRMDYPTLLVSVLGIFLEMMIYDSYMKLDPAIDKIPLVSLAYQDVIGKVSLVLFCTTTYMFESIIITFTGISDKWLKNLKK